MLLTKAQLTLFWRAWAAACKAQGWTRDGGLTTGEINLLRREILTEVGFRSLTEVDPGPGFDRLLARVRGLDDQLHKGALDQVKPSNGHRRRLVWKIEWLIKCLGIYLWDGAADTYVRKIVARKFARPGEYPRPWTELSADRTEGQEDSELDQLRMTLNARVNGRNGFRAKDGHTVHEMATKAGVVCYCEACRGARDKARATPAATRPRKPRKVAAPKPEAVASEPF